MRIGFTWPLLLLGLTATTADAQRLVEWTESRGELGLGYPVPIPVDTAMPFDGFRSHAGLHARHQQLLEDSARVTGQVVGETRYGRPIWAYRLAAPGDRTPAGRARAAIMYAGTLHAREWQSPEVVTGLMERAVAGSHDDSLTDYVAEHVNIVVVPVLNIDGFLQTQANPTRNWLGTDNRNPDFWPRDGRMRRKNLRDADEDFFSTDDHLAGVDLNRNNSPFWPGPPETGIPDDLTWRGPRVQSEPEIAALQAATDLAPASRLRFYADMHSYTRVFFSVHTDNERRNAIQSRLFSALSSHHAALPGDQVYVDSRAAINTGIGTTSEFFGHVYDIPSATWEIEPGQDGGAQYGGFRSNSHDGFILPESEIRRVRENLAETMLVAAYHMAGPPHVVAAEIRDRDSGAVVWSAYWDDAGEGSRQLLAHQPAALEPGRDYTLWVAFSKPMRWREDGQVVPFPGRPSGSVNVTLWLESGDQFVAVDFDEPQWLDQPGGPGRGFQRYRDDAFEVDFVIVDEAGNRALINELNSADAVISLGVLASDLTGQLLDADPATPVDWGDGAWLNYDAASGRPDSGGADRTLKVDVRPSADEPELVRAAHSAMWFNPGRSGEGWVVEILPGGQALGYWFTYDEEGEPRWLIGQGSVVANQIRFDLLLAPEGGRFGPDFDPADVDPVPAGSARLVVLDCDNGWLDYQAFGQSQRIALTRLTRTLGLSCDPPAGEPPGTALQSGTWFDPAHDGEGFTLQRLADGQVLVMWFTYDPTGRQFWLLGLGDGQAESIDLGGLTAARGPRFGRSFDADDLEPIEWGALQMQLGCDTGSASYQSILPSFGSGQFELLRLTALAGLACTAGDGQRER
ncbi:MAG: hypothetical protein HND55_05670 [Pseudomonadota bacterium]|nr:MAG: hypothetical protein HND55_05670 [Pseudomonadota bacterium]